MNEFMSAMATFKLLCNYYFVGPVANRQDCPWVNTVQLYNMAILQKLFRADVAVVGNSHNTYNKTHK